MEEPIEIVNNVKYHMPCERGVLHTMEALRETVLFPLLDVDCVGSENSYLSLGDPCKCVCVCV